MKIRLLYFLLLLISISSLTWISCKKDIKDEPTTQVTAAFAIPAAAPVTGSVSGIIVDENNIPVNGAEVKLGGNTATTGADGLFLFKNVSLDKYISTVTVNKAGYFKGVRSFSASAALNYVSIKLIPKTLAATVNSDNPTVVSLSNGSTIALQANSLVIKNTGAAYTGQVKVYAAYIDPTSFDMSTMVPGSLMGEDVANLYALQSTGMIAVDLESPAGEALQLISGKPASVKMSIPSSLQDKAPATIDTWSLDDRGVWIKEGTATKNGNAYEMQVTHFSFWNCDVPTNSTHLTIHLVDQNGNSLTNTLVSLTIPNSNQWWSTTYGLTDGDGYVSGQVPAGVELQMSVFSDPFNCNAPMYTQTIGPFTSVSSITVSPTFSNTNELNISGTATDCNNQPLANGLAIIHTSTSQYYYDTIVNGNYSLHILQCNAINSLSVAVIDITNGAQGNSGSIAINSNTVSVPSIQACSGTGQDAVFTFGNSQGICSVVSSTGQYTMGTAITGTNIVTVDVNVSIPGSFNISTLPVNGISFQGSGTFTSIGPQSVQLIATGTPVSGGTYTFTTQATGVTGCTFDIFVGATPAVINVPSSGNCPNAVVNGTPVTGFNLDPASFTISITLNVISPGGYHLQATSNDGFGYFDSGYVSTTGMVTFILQAAGAPVVPGNYDLPIEYNGVSGCTIPVTVLPNPNATFTFIGQQNNCVGATLAGTYTAGTPVGPGETVTLQVNVTGLGGAGLYDVSTNVSNGIAFSASGVFTTTGIQNITLTAAGTPQNAGLNSFQAQSASGVLGCFFTVQTN